ncbi:MAG: ATP-binding protein [Clostridia bacterium]|nr:ATP-binding protein [Clostridia bacterium]
MDIAQNSISAHASVIEIETVVRRCEDRLTITVRDNGCGMDADMLKSVTDPFTTSRTTRKVGLGIPFFRLGAEACGGDFSIKSSVGEGTCITASYQISHIDRPPMGDMAETMLTLAVSNPDVRFVYRLDVDETVFVFDTGAISEVLGDVPITEPEIVRWMKEYLIQGIDELNGGI